MKKNPASIPHSIWHADDIRRMEREAADSLGLTLYELMQQAGEAAFQVTREAYPNAQHWLVLCGHGNNGGDGYVVARLAKAQGFNVTLLAHESDKPLPERSRRTTPGLTPVALFMLLILTGQTAWTSLSTLSGTGLKNAPREPLPALIERANSHPAPTIAIDIPSGLLAQTGRRRGSHQRCAYRYLYCAQARSAHR
jgi:NAD(P)H-hydrate epimerase